jgi:hypothetical protein
MNYKDSSKWFKKNTMHYKLSTLSPTQIVGMDKLPIAKQEEIKAQFGQPLVLSKAYYMVRDASANFTASVPLAIELDNLIYQLLQKKGYFHSSKANNAVTDNAAVIGEALQALEAALEFSDEKTQIQEAIAALKVAMEFA